MSQSKSYARDDAQGTDPVKQAENPATDRPLPETDAGGRDEVGQKDATRAVEAGGPPGPEPTRYGDWERKGRCIDF